MSKDKKSKQRKPNLSPAIALRPRLDGLINNPGWLERDSEAIQADLLAITKGVSPAEIALVFVAVRNDSPDAIQEKLSGYFSEFLGTQGYLEALTKLVAQHQLPFWAEETVRNWLQRSGVEVAIVPTASTFFRAYYGIDEFGSQGTLVFLWYNNRQRDRAAGMGWLLDFNPPWFGCVKDCHPISQEDATLQAYTVTHFWRDKGLELQELDAIQAKSHAITALAQNKQLGIRLHKDFYPLRDKFAQHILSLPDPPELPAFSLADLDYVLKHGKSSEEINLFERRVGRRVIMEDGKELFVGMDVFGDDD